MHRVIFEPERGQRVPLRLWARSMSEETVRQLLKLASQPYVALFVAAMADAHLSESVAVGSVFATESTVVPGALGGDLGCGMSATRLGIHESCVDRTSLEQVLDAFAKAIPVGDATHRGGGIAVPDPLFAESLSTNALQHAREALAPRHLGTLGGGNHFVELDRDAEGELWLLVHSGSRGLGGAIAAHHTRAAGAATLAGLNVTDASGASYLRDLTWALAFARANRSALSARAVDVLASTLGIDIDASESVDVHHNFVAEEEWFGRRLLVHRKGAIAAPPDSYALVPGSMGTASYVVRGLGSESSFGSCSHGAGRVMSRKEARGAIQPKALAQAMRGVVYPERIARRLVEEAPAAYRDIVQVLEDQTDLVTREVRLEPLLVLKG